MMWMLESIKRDEKSVLYWDTYCHLHMVYPVVVLLVDNFKKIPNLSRKPVRQ